MKEFDLDAYLARIAYDGKREASLPALQRLHAAHLARIPFENIDVRLGRPIDLDLASLLAKLVARKRGGYCFEQNTLLAAALRALGFEVATLEARVRRPGEAALLPRTHMLLQVEIGSRAWLADVGFGADGPLLPVPFGGTSGEQPDADYRVAREGEAIHVLQARRDGAWHDLYAFTLAPAFPIDFEVANHFTATHPSSPFLKTLTVQRSEEGVRQILRGRTYTVVRQGREVVREIDPKELPDLLRDSFGMDVPVEEALTALGTVEEES